MSELQSQTSGDVRDRRPEDLSNLNGVHGRRMRAREWMTATISDSKVTGKFPHEAGRDHVPGFVPAKAIIATFKTSLATVGGAIIEAI